MTYVLLIWLVGSADIGVCTRANYGRKGLDSIPANGTSSITILYLKHNLIRRLVTDALTTYPNIHSLNLVENTLRYIDEGAFNGIYFLKTMYLSNNDIVASPLSFGAVIYTLEVLHIGSGFDSQGVILTKPYFSEFGRIQELRIGFNRLNASIDTILPPNLTFISMPAPLMDVITFPNLAKFESRNIRCEQRRNWFHAEWTLE